ncbi:hypothetical protein BGW42_002641 [Actinomortierella wolfii]|nr:hypothetical protein BGW42_002641 [Actinomortierella wolfii]
MSDLNFASDAMTEAVIAELAAMKISVSEEQATHLSHRIATTASSIRACEVSATSLATVLKPPKPEPHDGRIDTSEARNFIDSNEEYNTIVHLNRVAAPLASRSSNPRCVLLISGHRLECSALPKICEVQDRPENSWFVDYIMRIGNATEPTVNGTNYVRIDDRIIFKPENISTASDDKDNEQAARQLIQEIYPTETLTRALYLRHYPTMRNSPQLPRESSFLSNLPSP